jgi:hypothetical protein
MTKNKMVQIENRFLPVENILKHDSKMVLYSDHRNTGLVRYLMGTCVLK